MYFTFVDGPWIGGWIFLGWMGLEIDELGVGMKRRSWLVDVGCYVGWWIGQCM